MLGSILEPLGHIEGKSFIFYIKETKSILQLSASSLMQEANYLAIADTDRWMAAIELCDSETRFKLRQPIGRKGKKSNNEEGDSASLEPDWKEIGALLMKMCRAKGPFDPAIVRGRGLWLRFNGELAFNTGNKLYVYDQSRRTELVIEKLSHSSKDSDRYVSKAPEVLAPGAKPATIQECQNLFETISLFHFARGEAEAALILGWMACAHFSNFIDYRPHIAVTAEHGAGKSALVRFIVKLFGKDGVFHVEAESTTEPGLRQSIGYDSLPIICDEFETTSDHTKSLLQFFRFASNPQAGAIIKGSSGGVPSQFYVRSCVMIAGITIVFKESADASRFALIELIKKRHTQDEKRAFMRALDQFDENFGARLARRLIDRREAFFENLQIFAEAINVLGEMIARQSYLGTWRQDFGRYVTMRL